MNLCVQSNTLKIHKQDSLLCIINLLTIVFLKEKKERYFSSNKSDQNFLYKFIRDFPFI